MMKDLRLFIILLILSITINLLVLNVFFKTKKIAVVDMQLIINEYTLSLAKVQNTNDKEQTIENFVKKLNALTKQISIDNNVIILPKQAVFSGEDFDITNAFRQELYEK